MSEKHLPYIGGNFNRIIFDGDGSTWVREQLGTHYYELFGTPERAARTIMGKQLTYDLLEQCDDCPYQTDECFEPSGKCAMDSFDVLLEWLRCDAE